MEHRSREENGALAMLENGMPMAVALIVYRMVRQDRLAPWLGFLAFTYPLMQMYRNWQEPHLTPAPATHYCCHLAL